MTSFVRGVFGASDDEMPSVGGVGVVVNIECEEGRGGREGEGTDSKMLHSLGWA